MADSVLCIVVARASGSLVAETVRSLAAQSYQDLHVVIAAPPGTIAPSDRVRVVSSEPDKGFADAVGRALIGTQVPDRYLLLMHDDVVLDPDAVRSMVTLASTDPSIAAVGPKLVEWDDPQILQEVGGGIDHFAYRRSALDAGEIDAGQRDDIVDVLYCSDACLLVRTDVFAEIGGFDPDAWPLYEDVDLCWRLRASGRRVVVATSARVRHAALLSRSGVIELDEAVERGRLRFILKNFAGLGLVVLLPQIAFLAAARLLAAAVQREFWKVRSTVRAWSAVIRELPRLRRARRSRPRGVEDRQLLGLGARSAALERRGERAESLARASAAVARGGRRLVARSRDPVSWTALVAVVVVLLTIRSVVLGRTFTLGELRPIPTFGGALHDLFARARPEGLDPFAPPGPGLAALGLLRSVALSASLAEKLALVLPLLGAAFAGRRIGRVLSLSVRGSGVLAVAAAVNPVTLSLLRDGSIGALVTWTASLWLAASMWVPPIPATSRLERIRFTARWAVGWAVVVALHPPALIWLVALGGAITLALRGDGNTPGRLHAIVTGAVGSLVLLAPWSIEWFTPRTPLVGHPGWLVGGGWSGIGAATLGADWPLAAWIVVGVAGAYFTGLGRTSLAVIGAGAGALLLGTGGAMPQATMLVGVGSAAFVLVALVARRISDELPRYELGRRQAFVVAGTVVLVVAWGASAVLHVAGGVRRSDTPLIASTTERTGRVLWLARTSGGLRSWTTLGFHQELGAFPAPSGPAEELASDAIQSARGGRMHRAGGVLALADISHVVTLDDESGRGLDEQADLAPIEVHEHGVVYRNDAWRGPVMLLSAEPTAPLTSHGLAEVVRTTTEIPVVGWPSRRITFQAPASQGVVYVTGGPRRGWRIDGARATMAAAGVGVDASMLSGTVDARPPHAWHFLVPLEFLLGSALVLGWAAASYFSQPPSLRPPTPLPGGAPVAFGIPMVAGPVLAVACGIALGWTGIATSANGPFLSAAWYCPPVGIGFGQVIGIANPNNADVEFQVRNDLSAPPKAEAMIASRSRETLNVSSDQGAVVESFGHRLAVAAAVRRGKNLASSLCSAHARELNFFPEGGRAATRARPRLFERYLIFNPFEDVARVSVRFVSPNESIAPPALQDVQVKAGTFAVVNPEAQFEPMLDLSTVVRVWQGRAIVARRLETVEQVSWSLGALPITDGVLPRAETRSAVTEIIGLNPFDVDARVNVLGSATRGSIPEDHFDVNSGSRVSYQLNSLVPDIPELVVSLAADHPVAVESLVVPSKRSQLSLLPPLSPGPRWVIPMAEQRTLIVANPGSRPVSLSVQRLGPGEPIDSRRLEPNSIVTIALPGPDPFGLDVRATGPITAAVFGGPGALPGVPLS